MSHWTKSKVIIKDLAKLRAAAEKMGLQVEQGELTMTDSYAGTVKAAMIIRDNSGGQAAVVKDKGEGYRMQMDNYSNSLVSKVGRSCSTLCRDYATEVVRAQAMMMGGIVQSQQTLETGEVELRIALA